MSLTHARNMIWTCEACNCKTNPVRAVECAICGCEAPRTRFGVKAHGKYVLVSLHNSRQRAFARIFDVKADCCGTEELPNAETLGKRVRTALRTALDGSYKQKRDVERKRAYGVARSLAAQAREEHKAGEGAARATGDLFAQVMAHDRSTQNGRMMQSQLVNMRRKIDELTGDGAAESAEPRGFRKSEDVDEARVLIDAGAAARASMIPCGCCERPFRNRALLGIATFHAIAEWRARRGSPIDPRDARHAQTRRYEGEKLCLFCTQFFDEDFAEYVRIAGVGDDVLNVDDPVLRLARGPAVDSSRPLRREQQALPPVRSNGRPASTLRTRMAKTELQMRAAQPLKMDPWGSHLGAYRKKKPEREARATLTLPKYGMHAAPHHGGPQVAHSRSAPDLDALSPARMRAMARHERDKDDETILPTIGRNVTMHLDRVKEMNTPREQETPRSGRASLTPRRPPMKPLPPLPAALPDIAAVPSPRGLRDLPRAEKRPKKHKPRLTNSGPFGRPPTPEATQDYTPTERPRHNGKKEGAAKVDRSSWAGQRAHEYEPPPPEEGDSPSTSPQYKANDDAGGCYGRKKKPKKRKPPQQYARSTARPPVNPRAIPREKRLATMLTSGAHVRDPRGRETRLAEPHMEDPAHVLGMANAGLPPLNPRKGGAHRPDSDAPSAEERAVVTEAEKRRRKRRDRGQASIYEDGTRVPEARGRETARHQPHMYTRDEEDYDARRAHRRRKKKADQPMGRKTQPVSGITKAALCYV